MEDDNEDVMAEDEEDNRPDVVSYVDSDPGSGGGDLSNQSSNSS